ncbi:hypothetical protein [Helicobacter cetorum]|uniref:hypothetical protein n=1 Tax=Helicobacter cetorum TaxID=138563 RepID=UPI000CF02A9E|nr:hypothetical protein [Helicobacter cetorum]
MKANLKHLSKISCVILVSVLSECEAHPKSGFFIEAGFESGMSSVVESIQKRSNPQPLLDDNSYQKESLPSITISKKETANSHISYPSKNQSENQINTENSQNKTPTASIESVSSPKEQETQTQANPSNQQNNSQNITQNAEIVPQIENDVFKPVTIKNNASISSSNLSLSDLGNPTANSLFADTIKLNNGSIKFSTKIPVRLDYDSTNQKVTLQNFVSTDLTNIDLYVKVSENGQIVEKKIATITDLPQDSSATFDSSKISALAELEGGIDPSDFLIKASETSSKETKEALTALGKITTNIHGHFTNEEYYNGGWTPYKLCGLSKCFEKVTQEYATGLTKLLFNFAYVLDSEEWKNAILNAKFDFKDRCGSHTRLENCNNIVSKETIVEKMRSDSEELRFSVMSNALKQKNGIEGLGIRDLYALDTSTFSEYTNPLLWDSKAVSYGHLEKFYQFMHEYAHTKGYMHYGNMTYNGGDKIAHGEGFTSITAKVWLNMAQKGEIPFQVIKCTWDEKTCSLYNKSEDVPYFKNLNTPSNAHYFAYNFMVSNVSNMMQTLNDTIQSSINPSPTSKRQKSPMLGFNTQIGYQNYFNNVVGLSYYAMFNYNFSKRQGLLNKTEQYGVGGGVNLLIDFINVYAGKNFKSSFGVFAGARGLYNYYKFNGVINANKHRGNVYFTTGLNYRYKHSKISLGISMPLIKQSVKAQLITENLINEVALNQNTQNMHVFMNYGWVF